MKKSILAIGIIFLFVVLAVSPFTYGYNVKLKERDKYWEDIPLILLDNPNSSKKFLPTRYFQQGYNNTDEDTELIKKTKTSMIASSNGPMDSAWPMFAHDPRHTGRSPYSTADNPLTEKWRYFCEGWIMETPSIDNNSNLYIKGYNYFGGDNNSNLYIHGYNHFGGKPFYFKAINPNGTVKWMKQIGEIDGSSPAIAEDGTIYVGTNNGLIAMNPNGTQKWRATTDRGIFSSPSIAEDGTIYCGTWWSLGGGGKIYAINPNGTKKWQYQTGYSITSSPAIGNDGTVYIGSYDKYLYAMYPNGTLRWRFKTGDYIGGSPSIADDGTIYLPSYDDYLYALNPNGTLIWKYNTGYGAGGAPAIGHDGTIYVGTDKIYAIYPDGTLKWSFNLGKDRHIGWSSPAVSADGTIFIGLILGTPGYSDGGEIIAVNPDGTERMRKRISQQDWIDSSPSIGEDGTVYIGSLDTIEFWPDWWTGVGSLHAFGKVDSNTPPEKPNMLGSPTGMIGFPYVLFISAEDPDINPINFYIDWGDGKNSNIGPFASGEIRLVRHRWWWFGEFTIKARAQDEFGGESDWAEFVVTMPRDKIAYNALFLRFLERFPLLNLLLQRIFE